MIPLGAGVGRILETSRFLEEIRTYTPMGRGISWEEGWEWRIRREEEGLSLREAAEILQIRATTLGRWERGESHGCLPTHAHSLFWLREWRESWFVSRRLGGLRMQKGIRAMAPAFLLSLFSRFLHLAKDRKVYGWVLPCLEELLLALHREALLWILDCPGPPPYGRVVWLGKMGLPFGCLPFPPPFAGIDYGFGYGFGACGQAVVLTHPQ